MREVCDWLQQLSTSTIRLSTTLCTKLVLICFEAQTLRYCQRRLWISIFGKVCRQLSSSLCIHLFPFWVFDNSSTARSSNYESGLFWLYLEISTIPWFCLPISISTLEWPHTVPHLLACQVYLSPSALLLTLNNDHRAHEWWKCTSFSKVLHQLFAWCRHGPTASPKSPHHSPSRLHLPCQNSKVMSNLDRSMALWIQFPKIKSVAPLK
jgi:hypothetical protein